MVMSNKVVSLLKNKNYVVPEYLLKNYVNLGLNSNLLIIIIYLINLDMPIICDYKKISEDLNLTKNEILSAINELKEKGFIEIELKKNNASKLEEYINLEPLYNKLFLFMIDKEEIKEDSNIYSTFEKELGRILSPIEYELIGGWLDMNYKEEIILAALKEAVFNGVNNFRYIDRILFEWNKKGIDSIEKVNKNKKEYKKQKEEDIEVPDYDWLNENE
jgi:DNA replication protein